jgi:hypothetical protein
MPAVAEPPPTDSICEPYSAVVTWPTSSPPAARTAARSGPRCRSVSIFTFTPQ